MLPSKFPGRHRCLDGIRQGDVRLPLEGFDVLAPGAGMLGLCRGRLGWAPMCRELVINGFHSFTM